jgi:hypothetical protein
MQLGRQRSKTSLSNLPRELTLDNLFDLLPLMFKVVSFPIKGRRFVSFLMTVADKISANVAPHQKTATQSVIILACPTALHLRVRLEKGGCEKEAWR